MRRPSAAFIISCLALMAALGGSAVAAKLITGKNIRDRSITGRDLKSNTITGRVAANLSGRDILSDSLDGTDIAENQLGTVPRARSAQSADQAAVADRATTADTADALTGARIARVHFARPASSEGIPLDLGGLRLKATCNASGAMTVTAATATGPGWIRVSGSQQSGNNSTVALLSKDDDFRPGEEFNILPGGADNAAGELVYVAGDGSTVSVTFLAEQGVAAARGYACLFAGTAVQAAA